MEWAGLETGGEQGGRCEAQVGPRVTGRHEGSRSGQLESRENHRGPVQIPRPSVSEVTWRRVQDRELCTGSTVVADLHLGF